MKPNKVKFVKLLRARGYVPTVGRSKLLKYPWKRVLVWSEAGQECQAEIYSGALERGNMIVRRRSRYLPQRVETRIHKIREEEMK